jgi:hypothetical protein
MIYTIRNNGLDDLRIVHVFLYFVIEKILKVADKGQVLKYDK